MLIRTIAGCWLGCFIAGAATAADWPQYGGPSRNFCVAGSAEIEKSVGIREVWRRDNLPGKSTITIVDDTAFIPFAGKKEGLYAEGVVALDAKTGAEKWRFETAAKWNDAQETFGGEAASPQATPAVVDDTVIFLGFAGKIFAVDAATGDVRWQRDTIAKDAAPPVQFGFAASPLITDVGVVVLIGGKEAGLVCFDVKRGDVQWQAPCAAASYATPVLAEIGGVPQIVFMTRDRVVGVDPANGTELWAHTLSETGLTNVPTPLVVAGDRVIISAQGVKGVRCLRVMRVGTDWNVSEEWFNRKAQYFYSNWLPRDEYLLGCDGKLLVTLGYDDGKPRQRQRGFAESNVVDVGNATLILDGNGKLSLAKVSANETQLLFHARALDERCWTAPTVIGQRVYVRGGDKVACFDLVQDETMTTPNTRIGRGDWPLAATTADMTADPIGAITKAFETNGPDAAFAEYEKIRRNSPAQLSPPVRIELARLAEAQQLIPFARLVLQHGTADLPESTALREANAAFAARHPQ